MSIHLSSSISLSLVHIIFLCSCSSFRTFRYFSFHYMSIHLSFSISLSLVLNIVPCSFSSFSYFRFFYFHCMSIHLSFSISLSLVYKIVLCSCSSFRTFTVKNFRRLKNGKWVLASATNKIPFSRSLQIPKNLFLLQKTEKKVFWYL